MINQNIHAQNLQQTELVFGEKHFTESNHNLKTYVSKVTTFDMNQVKSYLGIFYFLLVSLLSITLLF